MAITSYDHWLEAMFNYDFLLSYYCSNKQAAANLSVYRRYIHTLQGKYKWEKVYQYDQKFRTDLARSHSFDFHVCNVGNFTEIFDADSLKTRYPESTQGAKRCFRCQSPQHLIGKCPFQEKAAEAAQAKAPSKEICYKFNDGSCFVRQCKRVHACLVCGGQHAKSYCSMQQQQYSSSGPPPVAGGAQGYNSGWPSYPPPPVQQSPRFQHPASSSYYGGDRPSK